MNRVTRPYRLLLLAAVLCPIIAFIVQLNNVPDIMLNDTYFILSRSSFIWLTASCLFVIWLLHLPVRKILGNLVLSWFHVSMTIVSVILFLLSPVLLSAITSTAVASTVRPGSAITANFTLYQLIVRAGVVLIILGQIFFVLNIIIGAFRKRPPHSGLAKDF